jgi:deoxyribonuclease V
MTDVGTCGPSPLAIVDVHYDDGARAACVVAPDWTAATPLEEHVVRIRSVLPYVPGRFFERELPCIVKVLSIVRSNFKVIVVDGYVYLDDSGTAGLGGHLYTHYGGQYAVVGVAKTAYRGSDFAVGVLRGSSKRPLFVTARGIPAEHAAQLVGAMHGRHRTPTLLSHVDRLARGAR